MLNNMLISFIGIFLLSFCFYLSNAQSVPAACLKNYAVGSAYREDPHLYADSTGTLSVTLEYYEFMDSFNNTNYCFITPLGQITPSFHLKQNQVLSLTIVNNVPSDPNNPTAVNIHFHGMAVNPVAPSDNIVDISIASGTSFTYAIYIPTGHSPGMYWYHPHVYVLSSLAVLGGGSGALIVDEIEQFATSIAGVDVSTVIIRGNVNSNFNSSIDDSPTWDLTVNHIPINILNEDVPVYSPLIMTVPVLAQHFFRIANNHANAILNIVFLYDNVPQPFQIIAGDGVLEDPLFDTYEFATSYYLSPGNRIELVITTPTTLVKVAELVTTKIDTGPLGDSDPARPLILFNVNATAINTSPKMPAINTVSDGVTWLAEASALRALKPNILRELYFSEVVSDPNDPASPTNFYITVAGADPTLFDPQSGPAIVTQQGNVEDWTVYNHAGENHVFHIHQIHFLITAINRKPVNYNRVYDSYILPYWDGVSMLADGITPNYPSITFRINWAMFSVGTFVYHCHILDHEDGGMMQKIQILPFDADPVPPICNTYVAAGKEVSQPKDLYSSNGVLDIVVNYYAFPDNFGNTAYCFTTSTVGGSYSTVTQNIISPTLHLHPGDTLQMKLTNNVVPLVGQSKFSTAVNVHFHGLAVLSTGVSDDIVDINVFSGVTFDYTVEIPRDHSPGMYWYHPHVYLLSSAAVLGGASGAIIIDDIEQYATKVAGMDTSTLIIRGQVIGTFQNFTNADNAPTWDLSVNYVPITYPAQLPALMTVTAGTQRFFRISNQHSNAILNIQFVYDDVPQEFQIVAIDGVLCDKLYDIATSFYLSPANRVELIITLPSASVQKAILQTTNIDTGPLGDSDPTRTLIKFVVSSNVLPVVPLVMPDKKGFDGYEHENAVTSEAQHLKDIIPFIFRKIYFSEVVSDPNDPSSPTNFYVTVDDGKAVPTLFNPDLPPAVVTQQGFLEEWVITNRAGELHVFHIHQVHFLVTHVNGVAVDLDHVQDSIVVGYWDGVSKNPDGTPAYPSVTVRFDWANIDVGIFVFHCHILDHEDQGMMQKIQVLQMTDTYGLFGGKSWSTLGPHGCPIYFPLKSECFGRGQCSNAQCVCDSGWSGFSPLLPNILDNSDCENNINFLLALRIVAIIPAIYVALVSFRRLHISTFQQCRTDIQKMTGVTVAQQRDVSSSYDRMSSRDGSKSLEIDVENPSLGLVGNENPAIKETKVLIKEDIKDDTEKKTSSFDEVTVNDNSRPRRQTIGAKLTAFDGDNDAGCSFFTSNDLKFHQKIVLFFATILFVPVAFLYRTYIKVLVGINVCSFLNLVTMFGSISYQKAYLAGINENATRATIMWSWAIAVWVFWGVLTLVFYTVFDTNIRTQLNAKKEEHIPLLMSIKLFYGILFALPSAAQLSFLSILYVPALKSNLNTSFSLFAVWGVLLGVNVFFHVILAIYALKSTNKLLADGMGRTESIRIDAVRKSGRQPTGAIIGGPDPEQLRMKAASEKLAREKRIILNNNRMVWLLVILGVPTILLLCLPPVLPFLLRASDYVNALFSVSAQIVLIGVLKGYFVFTIYFKERLILRACVCKGEKKKTVDGH